MAGIWLEGLFLGLLPERGPACAKTSFVPGTCECLKAVPPLTFLPSKSFFPWALLSFFPQTAYFCLFLFDTEYHYSTYYCLYYRLHFRLSHWTILQLTAPTTGAHSLKQLLFLKTFVSSPLDPHYPNRPFPRLLSPCHSSYDTFSSSINRNYM